MTRPIGRAGTNPSTTLLQSNEAGIVLEVAVGSIQIANIEVGQASYHRLTLPEFSYMTQPGAPELPEKLFMLAVPPDALLSLRVVSGEIERVKGFRITPCPQQVLAEPLSGAIEEAQSSRFVTLYGEDRAVYSGGTPFPSDLAEMAGHGRLRDQRCVQIAVHPIQFLPLSGEIRIHHHLRIELSFSYPPARASTVPSEEIRPESEIFESILRSTFLNAESARKWRRRPDPWPPSRSGLLTATAFPVESGQPLERPPTDNQTPTDLLTATTWALEAGRPLEIRFECAPRRPPTSEQVLSPAWKIGIQREGFYRLGYSDLKSAGVPVDSLDPRSLKLKNRGEEVAIDVNGESDGRFDPQDEIVFFGQAIDTRYSRTNVYWLTSGGAPGLRMPSIDGAPTSGETVQTVPARVHLEENLLYRSAFPFKENAEHWYWDQWLAPSLPPSASLTFPLPNLASSPSMAVLRARFVGFTTVRESPDHHVRVLVNDRLAGDVLWDGQTETVKEFTFPQSFLIPRTNTVRLILPHDTGASIDGAYLDWIEVDYRANTVAVADIADMRTESPSGRNLLVGGFSQPDIRVYDVSESGLIRRFLGTRIGSSSPFQVSCAQAAAGSRRIIALTSNKLLRPLSIAAHEPSTLRSPANSADYLLITHRDFRGEAERLATHRRALGLRTVVVDVEDIYDEFSGGIVDAEAIRSFISYAYTKWTVPAPSYVLLMGDGNQDPKNNAGDSDPTFIPPYLALVDPWLGETAAENRFVTVSGDDPIPDLLIGRLPVSTPAEARVVVDKILNYEQRPPVGGWQGRVTFVADNRDAAGDFPAMSDAVITGYLPRTAQVEKLYLGVTNSDPELLRSAVIRAFNDGRAIIHYVGHSSIQFWGSESLFAAVNVPQLRNGALLPVMIPMTCYDGYFHSHLKVNGATYSCLGEVLLRAEGRGSVASWTATGLGVATGHEYLDRGFFDAVYRRGVRDLGRAALLGKLNLYNTSAGWHDLIDTYTILGDPALRLNLEK